VIRKEQAISIGLAEFGSPPVDRAATWSLKTNMGEAGDRSRYALRRKSEARTRPRNCSGVAVGRRGSGFGLTTAGATAFVAFFAVSLAASRASCRRLDGRDPDPSTRQRLCDGEPRVVIAVGACAASGGIVGEGYASAGGVDRVLPVDVYIPGCPPRPEAILFGILVAVGRLDARHLPREG
jgi:hypothetical protein